MKLYLFVIVIVLGSCVTYNHTDIMDFTLISIERVHDKTCQILILFEGRKHQVRIFSRDDNFRIIICENYRETEILTQDLNQYYKREIANMFKQFIQPIDAIRIMLKSKNKSAFVKDYKYYFGNYTKNLLKLKIKNDSINTILYKGDLFRLQFEKVKDKDTTRLEYFTIPFCILVGDTLKE
jgi:hypothetical protein